MLDRTSQKCHGAADNSPVQSWRCVACGLKGRTTPDVFTSSQIGDVIYVL